MRFLTGYFCCSQKNRVLTLQRVIGRDKRRVVFLCLCGEEQDQHMQREGELGVRLEKWFYRQALPCCEKRGIERCVDRVKKEFVEVAERSDSELVAFFSVEGEGFYAWKGGMSLSLLNLSFGTVHAKSLVAPTQNLKVLRTQTEPGVGLLLGTETLLHVLPKEMVQTCLDIRRLDSTAQLTAHVRELVTEGQRSGVEGDLAMLLVKEDAEETQLPMVQRSVLAGRGFVVQECIGTGAFGNVYRLWDAEGKRSLACKVARDTQKRRILRREAMLLKGISHPLFATYEDCLEAEGYTMLLMEYIPGESLARRLERKPLSQKMAVRVARQLAEGLSYLHALPGVILYRDMNAENVCLAKGGRVKLLDLGCACSMAEAGTSRAGSPGYAPREQIHTEAIERLVGPYSDVYALGKLLQYMLTGVDPCRQTAPKTSTRQSNRKLSPQLEQIVAACVAEDPKDRIPDMKGVLERLVSI